MPKIPRIISWLPQNRIAVLKKMQYIKRTDARGRTENGGIIQEAILDARPLAETNNIKLRFELTQDVLAYTPLIASLLTTIQDRRVEISLDVKRGTATGTDYLYMKAAGPEVRSGEKLEIKELDLKEGDHLATTLPHTPTDNLFSIFNRIFDLLLCPRGSYKKADFSRDLSEKAQNRAKLPLDLRPQIKTKIETEAIYEALSALHIAIRGGDLKGGK